VAITYRILPADEYEKLTPFCKRNNLPFPVPGFYIICIAEDNGEICARWDILLQPHLDNGCIDEAYRKRCLPLEGMFALLKAQIAKAGVRLYSTSINKKALRLLRRLGFKAYEQPLYTMEF
jgi:hypothetical protein